MIRLPVATVLGDVGKVETLRIWLEDEWGIPKVELRRITDKGGVFEQVQLARASASAFLSRPYVAPLVSHTLERGTLIVEAEESSTYRGGSFGLAFLSACLALGLEANLKPGRLFTAKLSRLVKESGCPGGGVELESVGLLPEKLAAACMANQAILFLFTEDEKHLTAFEEHFWRGEASWNCMPKVLPKSIATASFVGTSLDTAPLLKRSMADPDAAAFALLMLEAAAHIPDGVSFAEGIGDTISQLRGHGRLSCIETLKILSQDMGMPALSDGDQFIQCVIPNALAACPEEKMAADLIKAAIATDPAVDCWAMTPEPAGVPDGEAAEEVAFDAWLNAVEIADPYRLFFVLAVIGIVSKIAPDYEGYWRQSKRVILNGLFHLANQAAGLIQRHQERNAVNLLSYLRHRNLGEAVGRLRPEWMPEIVEIFGRLANTLRGLEHGSAYDAADELLEHLSLYNIPEIFQPLQVAESNSLHLTFRLANQEPDKKPRDYPRPALLEINDLEMTVTGPQKLLLRIPSPVLLMEDFAREPRFFWHQGDVLADNTLSRYPVADAQMLSQCFSHPAVCNRIGFQIRAGSREPPASIQWHAAATPWPPAIDTQLLVATMVQWGQNFQPKSLLDVGCGTGYLAIAGCHLWPSLEDVHLADIDPASVWAAEINLQNDSFARSKRLRFFRKAFENIDTNVPYDVLVCNPPYLPNRPLPTSRIETATNNTYLLEQVIQRGGCLARQLWLVFSSLAWHEFRMALAKTGNCIRRIEILRRDFVPFRISWLAPRTPQEQRGGDPEYNSKERYFTHTLMPRGLIDFNSCAQPWPEYLHAYKPTMPEGLDSKLIDYTDAAELEHRLDLINADCRGFRFWHEVRVVRLSNDPPA